MTYSDALFVCLLINPKGAFAFLLLLYAKKEKKKKKKKGKKREQLRATFCRKKNATSADP
jgi:hypothetical protein